MSYLAVAKFDKHQHYKHRRPPWIKFYVDLLDPKHPINQLPIPTRYLFDRLLLLAANWDNAIPNDSELIAKHVGMETKACREGINQLIQGRWLREKQTARRASKRASTIASKSLPTETESRDRKRTTKQTALRDAPPADSTNGHPAKLNPTVELDVHRLIALIHDKDERTEAVVQRYAAQVPHAVIVNLREALERRPDRGAGWVVNALKSEARIAKEPAA